MSTLCLFCLFGSNVAMFVYTPAFPSFKLNSMSVALSNTVVTILKCDMVDCTLKIKHIKKLHFSHTSCASQSISQLENDSLHKVSINYGLHNLGEECGCKWVMICALKHAKKYSMSMCITSYFIISSGSNLYKGSDPFWVDDELQ